MMPRFRMFVLSAFALCAFACQSVPLAAQSAESLAPRMDWRMAPEQVIASMGGDAWGALAEKRSLDWEVSYPGEPWVAMRLPPGRTTPAMLTYWLPDQPTAVALAVGTSADSTDGRDGAWTEREMHTPGKRLEKIVLEEGEGPWLRVRVVRMDKSLVPATLRLREIGLYAPSRTERNDYWLSIGASIQAQSLRQDVFHEMVTARHPGYDPVLFNEAVSGWRTEQLRENLPGLLAKHPFAGYVTIHIGGNNVSAERPYPGGAEKIEEDLRYILETIRASGKEPILSRLSYRAYKEGRGKPGVPPEENGSGPYVTAIFDPMIREYCPRFYDEAAGRGNVDAYNWFKEHPEELSTDGIHVNKAGQESWNRLWAEGAGGVVYGSR